MAMINQGLYTILDIHYLSYPGASYMPKTTRYPINIGKWTFLEKQADKRGRTLWLCRCECGLVKALYPDNVDHDSQCKRCFIDSMAGRMEGRQFGQLIVVDFSHSDLNSKYYNCLCSCGKARVCNGSELRLGRVKRCRDCKHNLHRATGHGMKKTSIWVIWMGIKARCLNPNNRAYKNYGGRGITVCESWKEFKNFYADMGDRPEGMQIDRIDNDKGYFKENCHWVTPKQNSSNRRVKS